MTTTLNATTSNGLVVTPDNSGNIQLQYNGVAAPAFSAYASAGTSLPNATFTKINYATENFDTNNNYASSRFTPTVAGYYQISAGTRLGSITASIVVFYIYKNGVTGASGGSCSVSSGYVYPFVSSLIYLNGSTDYVEIYCYQNSGSTTTTDFGGSGDYLFTGCLLRGA